MDVAFLHIWQLHSADELGRFCHPLQGCPVEGRSSCRAGRDTLNGPPAEASYPGGHLVSPQVVEEVETLTCC